MRRTWHGKSLFTTSYYGYVGPHTMQSRNNGGVFLVDEGLSRLLTTTQLLVIRRTDDDKVLQLSSLRWGEPITLCVAASLLLHVQRKTQTDTQRNKKQEHRRYISTTGRININKGISIQRQYATRVYILQIFA